MSLSLCHDSYPVPFMRLKEEMGTQLKGPHRYPMDPQMWTRVTTYSNQSSQPPIFCPDICAKSESNPKCLRKSLHKANPKSAYSRQNAIHDKMRVNGT